MSNNPAGIKDEREDTCKLSDYNHSVKNALLHSDAECDEGEDEL